MAHTSSHVARHGITDSYLPHKDSDNQQPPCSTDNKAEAPKAPLKPGVRLRQQEGRPRIGVWAVSSGEARLTAGRWLREAGVRWEGPPGWLLINFFPTKSDLAEATAAALLS